MSCDFDDIGLDDRILRPIYGLGITQATEVQRHIITAVGSATDVIVEAQPGQGRTTALCVAMLQKLVIEAAHRILFLVPTKEVGQRVRNTFMPLASHLDNVNATCHAVLKGNSLRDDVKELRERPTVVAAQATRLAMIRKTGEMDTDGFSIIVLLQAEHLLDDDKEEQFDADVLSLMDALPKPKLGRQTIICSSRPLLHSATNPFIKSPIVIKLNTIDPSMEGVWALFFRVDENSDEAAKIDALWPLYQTLVIEQVILFCEGEASVEKVRQTLVEEGFTCTTLYAHEGEVKRYQALREFRLMKSRALVTDIDVTEEPLMDSDHTDMVVHISMPDSAQEFKNRSGRRQRGQRKRLAVSYVTNSADEDTLEEYQRALGTELIEVDDENAEAAVEDGDGDAQQIPAPPVATY